MVLIYGLVRSARVGGFCSVGRGCVGAHISGQVTRFRYHHSPETHDTHRLYAIYLSMSQTQGPRRTHLSNMEISHKQKYIIYTIIYTQTHNLFTESTGGAWRGRGAGGGSVKRRHNRISQPQRNAQRSARHVVRRPTQDLTLQCTEKEQIK